MAFNPEIPFSLRTLPPGKIDLANPAFTEYLIKARTELAELKGYSFAMPNPMLLLSTALLRESLASSEIENINTTMEEVLQQQLFPEVERRQPDKEVLHYKDALSWGFENLEKFSLSTRLILGIQKKLLPQNATGYRKQQNKIANSTTGEVLYTPPIASEIGTLMSNLENYFHDESSIDPLIKCAISHYQFEAIHPFSDGNGRTGRILMVLYLIKENLLNLPVLYISGYINKNRKEYYRLLNAITSHGHWDQFILFMLKGFYAQAKFTKEALFEIMKLHHHFKEAIKKNHKKIYSSDLVDQIFSFPIITPAKLSKELGMHYVTATRHLNQLANSGLLSDVVQGKYHLYVNTQLMKILNRKQG